MKLLRRLARLERRTGNLEKAQELLSAVLAEMPEDRRARAVLNGLFSQRHRWEELDASLGQETREALRRGWLRLASRTALRRSRLWAETLSNPKQAALWSAQAAQYAEQSKDFSRAFALRVLGLRHHLRAGAPPRVVDDAGRHVVALGDRVGQGTSARALVEQLRVGREASASTLPLDVSAPAGQLSQVELVAVAHVAEAHGGKPEAAALLADAARSGPDPEAAQKLEAHLTRRGAWRELATFFRDALSRSTSNDDRARWAEKLAELLESELNDAEGAANAWGAVASATGDPRAVAEQVRLLALAKDVSGVREVLEVAVHSARGPGDRAQALVLRAEAAVARLDTDAARVDFQAALALVPDHPEASAGLAELGAQTEDYRPVHAFERVLRLFPRHAPGRGHAYRRLARLADEPLRDAALSQTAWTEVLAEFPTDEEACARLLVLARAAGDEETLEQMLKGSLARRPRGPRAQAFRLELVDLLNRAARREEALEAIKEAVRSEPGHAEMWLLYVERLEAVGGRDAEVAWALEQAAGATEDGARRADLLVRVGHLSRDRLGDEARAQGFLRRAQALRAQLGGGGADPATTVPLAVSAGKRLGDSAHPAVRVNSTGFFAQPSVDSLAVVAGESRVGEHRSGQEAVGVRKEVDDARRTAESDAPPAMLPTFGVSPARALAAERSALFERVRAYPLDADGYKLLAEHFDTASEPAHSALMLEIARALDGDPNAAPRAPRLILDATDRAGLKHPSLRSEGGELLALVALAICRLNPARGAEAGTDEAFGLESGKGARSTADALLSAVRILGVRSPSVVLGEDPGPPFALVFTTAARIVVGKVAVKKLVPEAELRFFAGRALFTLEPELMLLRNVRKEQVARGLELVSQVIDKKGAPAELKLLRDAVPPSSWERLRELVKKTEGALDLTALSSGARPFGQSSWLGCFAVASRRRWPA